MGSQEMTLYIGIDESNNGRLPEIFVAAHSLESRTKNEYSRYVDGNLEGTLRKKRDNSRYSSNLPKNIDIIPWNFSIGRREDINFYSNRILEREKTHHPQRYRYNQGMYRRFRSKDNIEGLAREYLRTDAIVTLVQRVILQYGDDKPFSRVEVLIDGSFKRSVEEAIKKNIKEEIKRYIDGSEQDTGEKEGLPKDDKTFTECEISFYIQGDTRFPIINCADYRANMVYQRLASKRKEFLELIKDYPKNYVKLERKCAISDLDITDRKDRFFEDYSRKKKTCNQKRQNRW
ncbi:MAG TPA: hypothetical protein VJI75_04785 [Candidatus Nanoarchaeia archaeon]|nr:hypothetical protein [Candidatus Nanoarchaeia archaeon]